MLRLTALSILTLVALFSCAMQVQAQLVINLDFTNFSTGAPADGDPILGGADLADAQAVVEHAATIWETVFAGSSSSNIWSTNVGGVLTQNISVGWGAHGGGTLATGGTNWYPSDGRWGSGTLTWDNDGSSVFFVDTTPTENSEWNLFTERDLSFNAVDVNSERVFYDAPDGGPVWESVDGDPNNDLVRTDMLTVAIHEVGHALGFLGGFPDYDAADVGTDNDIDITSGQFAGAQIDIIGGHTDFEIVTPSAVFPRDLSPRGFGFTPFDYGPNSMSPGILSGIRKGITEADIAIAAQFLQYDMSTVNFDPMGLSPVPEPSTFFTVVIGFVLISRRRKA